MYSDECVRVRKEMDVETEKLQRQKEGLNAKMLQTEKDLQLALKAEQQSHEEDLERMNKEKVRLETESKESIHSGICVSNNLSCQCHLEVEEKSFRCQFVCIAL